MRSGAPAPRFAATRRGALFFLRWTVGPERTFAPGDHRAKNKYFTADVRKRVLGARDQARENAKAADSVLTQQERSRIRAAFDHVAASLEA